LTNETDACFVYIELNTL